MQQAWWQSWLYACYSGPFKTSNVGRGIACDWLGRDLAAELDLVSRFKGQLSAAFQMNSSNLFRHTLQLVDCLLMTGLYVLNGHAFRTEFKVCMLS